MPWGKIVNGLLFFMTGLPGAIDYGMLALVQQGHLEYVARTVRWPCAGRALAVC